MRPPSATTYATPWPRGTTSSPTTRRSAPWRGSATAADPARPRPGHRPERARVGRTGSFYERWGRGPLSDRGAQAPVRTGEVHRGGRREVADRGQPVLLDGVGRGDDRGGLQALDPAGDGGGD